MTLKLPGAYEQDGDGFECVECGETIEQGERCIRIDHAKVGTNELGNPHVHSINFGAVVHTDCF